MYAEIRLNTAKKIALSIGYFCSLDLFFSECRHTRQIITFTEKEIENLLYYFQCFDIELVIIHMNPHSDIFYWIDTIKKNRIVPIIIIDPNELSHHTTINPIQLKVDGIVKLSGQADIMHEVCKVLREIY